MPEANLKSFEKRLRQVEKGRAQLGKLSSSVDKLGKGFDTELRALNKEIAPLFDKDAEFEKRARGLEKLGNDVIATLEKVQKSVSAIDKKVSVLEHTWDTPTLKRAVGSIATMSKAFVTLERKSAANVKNLERTNAGIVAISKHASDIEAEHTDAKFAAEELAKKADNLKDTVDHFFKQIDAVNGKLNANAATLSDIVSVLETLKGRIEAIEGQTANFSQFSSAINDQAKLIEQLTQRLAYLEKATVKTIVLD